MGDSATLDDIRGLLAEALTRADEARLHLIAAKLDEILSIVMTAMAPGPA